MKTTVHSCEAFLNADETQVSTAICLLIRTSSVEAVSVVFDNGLHLIGCATEDDADTRGTGMFCHIVECFLNNTVNGGLNFRTHVCWVIRFEGQIDFNVAVIGPAFSQMAYRFDQTKIVERGRPQFHCHAMQIARGLSGEIPEGPHLFCGRAIAVGESLESEIERSQILAHLIVEFTSNTAALLLLRVNQLTA